MTVSIDFETRSTKNIRLGLDQYVSCPEFEVLTLSWRFPGEAVEHWHRGFDCAQPPVNQVGLERLLDHVRKGGQVRGWNVMFEWMVWNHVGTIKYGWPILGVNQCLDTMAQAAVHNLPQALGKCGEALGLPADSQKSKRGSYLIQRLCCPHPPTKARDSVWVQDPGLFDELVAYCDQDVVAEESIAKKLRPLTPSQQDIWELTQKINRRGVPVDLTECSNILDIVEEEKGRLNKQLRTITSGAVTAASKRNDLLAWCNERQATPIEIEDPVDSDEDRPGHEEMLVDLKGKTVEAALCRGDLLPEVRRALEIRAAVVQTSTAKYSKMLQIAARDGTLKNTLVYHGAGTGRWASRGGINVQNFARPTLKDSEIGLAHQVLGRGDHEGSILLWGDRVMDAAVSCLRGVIKAPLGFDFIDADYSSVENRVASWIAGQWDKVELFAAGLDEYKTFASEWLYKAPYEAITKDQRQFTKPVILGGIFGLGAKGLVAYAAQMGVSMTLEEAEVAVKALRLAYRKVRDCWYECGDASIAAVQNPGHWFEAGDKLSLCCHKNFLWLELPSGRLLAWSQPRVEIKEAPWTEKHFVGYDYSGNEVHEERPALKDVVTVESIDTKTRLYFRHPLIGSSIFQSGVQATAADILGEGVMNTEDAGYQTVLLAHDENLALVREGWGDPDEFGKLMCRTADWRTDLPLAYEAWRGKRFRK